MGQFSVRVSKDYTVFCAGHFITYEGDKCESLHGHNYRAAASVEGDLTGNAYVFDFVRLKHMLRAICDRLDHRMLLPEHNPLIAVRLEGDGYAVRYRDKAYLFPRDDVVLLPIPNTTAEMIAQWIAAELEAALRQSGVGGLRMLEVEVEESFGQSAIYRRPLAQA